MGCCATWKRWRQKRRQKPINASLYLLRILGAFPYQRNTTENSTSVVTKDNGDENHSDDEHILLNPRLFQKSKSMLKIPILLSLTWIACIHVIIKISGWVSSTDIQYTTEMFATYIRDFMNVLGVIFMLTYLRIYSDTFKYHLTELYDIVIECGVSNKWILMRDEVYIIRTILSSIAIVGMFSVSASSPTAVNPNSNIYDNGLYLVSYTFCSLIATVSIWVIGTLFYTISNIMASVIHSLANEVSKDEIQAVQENNVKEQIRKSLCCSKLKRQVKVQVIQTVSETDNGVIDAKPFIVSVENENKFPRSEKLHQVEEKLFRIKYFLNRLNHFFAAPLLCICAMASLSTIIGTFFIASNRKTNIFSLIFCFTDFWNIVFLSLASRRFDEEVR